MSRYQIPYANACVRGSGKRFSISAKEAFRYLNRFGGIDFLIKFYSSNVYDLLHVPGSYLTSQSPDYVYELMKAE